MPKLSIIIPVYDVESYIVRCIDSVLNQTFTDFEVILVDDGSPDRCGEIIDEYAQVDERVVAVHQVNKGVSAARNKGLDVAQGDYIGFVDPDDWIESDMYEILIDQMENNNCDIASCSWMDNDEFGNERSYVSKLPSGVMNNQEYLRHLFDMPPSVSGSVCCKLFKKKCISHKFNEKYIICEDNHFIIQCCSECKRAVYINSALYHVFSRKNSSTRKEPLRTVLGLPARKEIISIAKLIDEECGDLAESLFLDQCISFCQISNKKINSKYWKLARKEFLSYLSHNPLCLLNNRAIPFKQKLFYVSKYINLISEKDNCIVNV